MLPRESGYIALRSDPPGQPRFARFLVALAAHGLFRPLTQVLPANQAGLSIMDAVLRVALIGSGPRRGVHVARVDQRFEGDRVRGDWAGAASPRQVAPPMKAEFARLLEPTESLDFEHGVVQRFTAAAIGEATDPVERARRVFTAVDDSVWYDPSAVCDDPQVSRASAVAVASRAYCIPKAVLLTACCPAAGIPARLGFADVRNHPQSAGLRQRIGGTDVFVYHGYSSMLPHGRWVKATPAFKRELWARFGGAPIEFDALRVYYGPFITEGQFVTEPAPPVDEFSLSTGRGRVTHAKHHAGRCAHREDDRGACGIDSR